MEIKKDKREGKIFLDYLRNSYGQTTVPPYAVRIAPVAPVATPLSWHELDNTELHSKKYNIKNICKRLSQTQDPWKDFFKQNININQIKI